MAKSYIRPIPPERIEKIGVIRYILKYRKFSISDIVRASGVTRTTILEIRDNKTLRPQPRTIDTLYRVIEDFEQSKKNEPEHVA